MSRSALSAHALRLSSAVMLLALVTVVPGCSRGASASHLNVSGSTTVLPIAEIAAEMFQEADPGTRVFVAGNGSSEGIESVAKGLCDIGTSSRNLKPEESVLGLVDTPIAHDAIAVIVNPANPVTDLTRAQVAGIFEGKIVNWKDVGGPDMPIGLVNRDEASGTREAFWGIVLDKRPFDPAAVVLPGTGQVRFVVAESSGAIGYISVGFIDRSVKPVSIDGVAPTEANIVSKRYPISRLLHFLTKGRPKGLAAKFIEFVLSPKIQDSVVRDAGFLPMRKGD